LIIDRLTAFLLLAALLLPTPLCSASTGANHKVEIFLTSWCPYCKKAVTFFADRKVPVQIFNIENDPEAARRKRELDPRNGVPLVIIDDQVIYGFSPKAFNTALDN